MEIELSPEEWGQVMMVLQGGIYRVVAPLLQKMNYQFTQKMMAEQAAAAEQQKFRLVAPIEDEATGAAE